MAAQARNDLPRVADHRRDEREVVGGEALDPGAGLDELLPDEEPEPVAELVEVGRLDQATAPDAQQVRVRARGEPEHVLELLWARNPVQHVEWHPVPPLDRDAHAVDSQLVAVEGEVAEAHSESV